MTRGLAVAAGALALLAGTCVPADAAPSAAVPRPPTTASCRADTGDACYSPRQLQQAYGTTALYSRGIDGRGRTIAVVDPFGSPTIRHDLQTFDRAFGLPDPALRIISPAGRVPAFDHADADMLAWAGETTLDVEYAHAMAPRARILLVTTPVAQTEGVHGLTEVVRAENYVVDHGLADVISQSFGATEQTFRSPAQLLGLRSAVRNAAAHHVTMVAASGDHGATDLTADGTDTYRHRAVSWPSSDPLVTSVGGTRLSLDAHGRRTARDTVWNDGADGGAGGGGTSAIFGRPGFQDRVRGVTGNHRGAPDVAMSAATSGGAIVYSSYDYVHPGWEVDGGTSEAAPLFAGLVALAAQRAGHRLGDLNPLLYRLTGRRDCGLVDVTTGDNTFAGVPGYRARRGYDLASGLGTVDATRLVPALAGTSC